MTIALEVRNLRVGYRRDLAWRETEVVHDISFSIPEGAFFGFLGHNGAGKTTTMKAILGLLTPSSGTVRIFGGDPRLPATRSAIGYLPEQPYFYDHVTVTELLHHYGALSGIPRARLHEATIEALQRVRLSGKAQARMRTLSKGLTQRVGMAQAIIAQPKLLLLDEPFSGLDPIGRKELRELLGDLHRAGTTIIMSSHLLPDVEFLCSQAAIIAHGTLRGIVSLGASQTTASAEYELTVCGAQDSARLLREQAYSHRTEGELLRLRFKDSASAHTALRDALSHGATIHSFERQSRSLEELFVEMVSSQPPVNGGEA